MTTVGFIGLGRMGMPMATNLLKAGFGVVGCDVDPTRGEELVKRGGASARDVAETARRSDIVITMIMNDRILHEVALGERGVLANLPEGGILADLSTVSPAASEAVGKAAAAAGRGYVCGKVAGSIGPATDATLTLFASGERADFDRCALAFAAIASTVRHVGAGDSAAYLKLVHSLIVGVYSSMIGEALAFGQRGGLELATIVDVLEAGPLGSKQLTLKAPVLKERRFASPPSDIDTAAKDVDLILDTARRDVMPLPLTSAVRQLMATAQAGGGGKRDIYSILETFERLGAVAAQQ
jgi:3-hydroxyisobutyrate dehydrogenase-like beta-hydroxyacid dehydrogenase